MKTGLVQVRPILVRNASRTRAHVVVTMLAVKGVRAMRRALVAVFGTTADEQMAVTVEEALVALARLCLLTYHIRDGGGTLADPRRAASGDPERVGDSLAT